MTGLQQISSPIVIVPAYGRTYHSKEDIMKDWNAGKDFKLFNGPYCSIRDLDTIKQTASTVYITTDHFTYITL